MTIAGKCWPAFQDPVWLRSRYVNSRLAAQGIPVSCEVDIYGALSEFIGTVVSQDAVTLLDINNSVPADMYAAEIGGTFDYTHKDTFMAFHCGNTASGKLASCEMKYQKIMARTLPEEVTQGTLEETSPWRYHILPSAEHGRQTCCAAISPRRDSSGGNKIFDLSVYLPFLRWEDSIATC